MYKINPFGGVVRLHDNASIPTDEDNMDYVAYLAWEAEGNTPEPADVPKESDAARAALDSLERETMMNRGMREYLLVSMQDLAMRQAEQMQAQGVMVTAKDILAANAAWIRLVDINTKAAALRAKL